MLRNSIVTTLCVVFGFSVALAQKTEPAVQPPPQMPIFSPAELAAKVPAAKAEDVKSQVAIMVAIYDVISGPAGTRDWKRFRSLFLPEARFTEVGTGPDGKKVVIAWSVDEFVRDASRVFAEAPFYEKAIVNEPESFGDITQVFSSYETRRSPTGPSIERGINSIQLLNDGARWWVLSILWDTERSGNPLPAKFSK
jgi:hypothetical protein